MKLSDLSVLLIGGGKMGGAMLKGWREQGVRPIAVVDPSPAAQELAGPGVAVYADAGELPGDFHPQVIVLAVKPQMAAAVLPAYRARAQGALVISIMAGKTIAALAEWLGPDARLVRAMPNTPAAIGQGITIATAAASVDQAGRDLTTALLSSVGEVGWVEEESQIDAVTAVSGSGPAYVFLLAEALEQAALAQGLPAELSRRLARATVTGSGNLLHASNETAAQLRQNVTSPGGTTAAALAVLMPALPPLMEQAVDAAAKRSRELSQG